MIPIRLKYINSIIEKSKNKFGKNRKFEIKQKRIGPKKNGFLTCHQTKKKTKKMRPVRLNSPSRS